MKLNFLLTFSVIFRKNKKHNAFNNITGENDIALLKLEKKVTFSRRIKPACLSDVDLAKPTPNAYITGWVYIAFNESYFVS